MARIELLHDYAGYNTRERRIQPGIYEADDPALFGLAVYLCEHGHAVWLAESETYTIDDGDFHAEVYPYVDLQAMTREELDEYAAQIGVDIEAIEGTGANGNVVKADVIRAIEAQS